MTDTTFDTLTRQTLVRQGRRAALQALGAAALAGATGLPLAVKTSAKGKSGKSGKKQALKLCRRQVGACTAQVNSVCQGNAGCAAGLLPCCQLLGRCNGTAFFACITDTPASN